MEAFEKRKKYIHIPAVFVLLMILCLAYSTQIFADTTKTKVVNTSQKTWIKVKYDSYYDENKDEYIYTNYFYKIQVSSPGFLEIKVKDGDVRLFDRLPKPEEDWSDISIAYIDSDETERIIVDKGTYYFLHYSDVPMVQYTFTSVKPTANYCMKKAATLKAGKNVTVCMSAKHFYSRWYKVKLKKKKSITFWSNAGDNIRVYNSKGKKIDTEHAGTQSTKWFTKRLKKGTYYIRILPSWNEVKTLKWN